MHWYNRSTQYLRQTNTRSGRGTLLLGKDANNNTQVMPVSSSSGYGSVQTSATGANWVALSSQVCGSVTIINNTGTTIEISKDSGTTKIQLPTGASFCVNFIINADNVSVRRADVSGTQVTAYYEWEA